MNKKVELTRLENCKCRLKVEVEPEQVAQKRAQITGLLAKRAALPGFRPGKAPETLVSARFQEEINREMLEEMIPESFRRALESEKLEPVGEPEFSGVELAADGLAYTVALEVRPEIELDGYDGLSLENRAADVSEKEVERVLGEVLERNLELRARAMDLKVREEIRRDLRNRMESEARLVDEQAKEEQIVGQLLARAKLSVPETMVRRRSLQLAREEIARTAPDFNRKTPEEREKIGAEAVEKVKGRAERDVKATFVLNEVARLEKVEVSEEEVDGRLEVLARLTGRERAEVAAGFDEAARADLKSRIRVEKTLDLLKRRCLLLEKPRIIKV